MRNNPALSLLSLAMKAGKIKSGEYAVEKAIRGGAASLVVIAADASDKTKQSYIDMCRFYKTDCIEYADRSVLGQSIGKDFRAAVAICDSSFANQFSKKAGIDLHSTTEVV